MQVEVQLKVSAEEFYALLIQSLREEVEKVKGKTFTMEELSGLRYKKPSTAKGQTVKVHVGKLVLNKRYTITTSMGSSWTKASYEIEEKGQGRCSILYTEEYSSQPKTSLLHSPQRRVKKMLRAAESYIIHHRD